MYDIVNMVCQKINLFVEKPLKSFSTNAGIYILTSEVLEHIPNDKFFDMPMLLKSLNHKNHNVNSFQLSKIGFILVI